MLKVHRSAGLIAASACLFLWSTGTADEPPAKSRLDPAQLPPGTVIIISDHPREAFQNIDAIVLSPEEYKKLLAAADRANKAADRPQTPSVCRLSGRVESRGGREVAVLAAEYRFRTTTPKTTVALGLQKGRCTAATLDGQMAALTMGKDEDGYRATVDSPGDHALRVELETSVGAPSGKPAERNFEIGLPGAAITTLEHLDLPSDAQRVRVGGRPLARSALAAGTAVVLGPIARLEIAWAGNASASGGDALFSVESKIDLRVDEKMLVSRSRLVVKALQGDAGTISIIAPLDAEVTAPATQGIVKPVDNNRPVWSIRRDSAAGDWTIDVLSRMPIEMGQPLKVAAVRVVGAAQQRGTVAIHVPVQLRLSIDPASSAEFVRRDASDDDPHESTLTFWQLPDQGPLVTLTAERLPGRVECQFQHSLTLNEHGWRWQGKIELRPVRAEVTQVEIDWPANFKDLRTTSADLVETMAPVRDLAGGHKLIRIILAEPRRRTTTISLEAWQSANPNAYGEVQFDLPRVVGPADRGGAVTVAAPSTVELQGGLFELADRRLSETEIALLPASTANTITAEAIHAPGRLRLVSRPIGRDSLVPASVQIQLGEHQATIRHEWKVPAIAATAPLRLRSPSALKGRLKLIAGGRVASSGADFWIVQPPANPTLDIALAVSYSMPLPDEAKRTSIAVPLVWLDGFEQVETTVRIWSGAQPHGARIPVQWGGPWVEILPQAVRDQPDLPTLSLQGMGTRLPLSLTIDDVAGGPWAGAVVERIWNQVYVEENARQLYRVRALVRPSRSQDVDIELPAAPDASQFVAAIDGKRVKWVVPNEAQAPKSVRVRIDPDAGHASRVLELTYALAASQGGRWWTHFSPPRWADALVLPAARWQIGFADGRAAFCVTSSAEFLQQWSWDRGVFRPEAEFSTAKLARWFMDESRLNDSRSPATDDTWVAVAAADQPLEFITVPRPFAWLICSIGVVGLATALMTAPVRVRASILIGVVAAVTWLALVDEQALSALATFGQPGLWMVGPILAVRWLSLRQRRHDAFLPRGVPAAVGGPSTGIRFREPSTATAPLP